jgi:hypothetical protein
MAHVEPHLTVWRATRRTIALVDGKPDKSVTDARE